MTAVAIPAPPQRPEVGELLELEREILTRIACGGLLIGESELRYQLHRRGFDTPRVARLLGELEQRGLIESETHYRLTAAGAAELPAGERPAPRGISSIPWEHPFHPPARAGGRPRRTARPGRPIPRRETGAVMT